jgi:hypothetical protein
MLRQLGIGLGGLLSMAVWVIGIRELAFGSITVGTILTVGSGLCALLILTAWRRDSTVASEGIIRTIIEYFGGRG